MPSTNIAYLTDTGGELSAVTASITELAAHGVAVTARATSQVRSAAERASWADHAASCDVVVCSLFAGVEGHPLASELLTHINELPTADQPIVHFQVPSDPATLREYAREASSTKHFDAITTALDAGGVANVTEVLRHLATSTHTPDCAPPHVQRSIPQGYYHPQTGPLVELPEQGDEPKVGLYFPAAMVREANLDVIDACVTALADQGLTAVPIFGEKFPDQRLAVSAAREMLQVDETLRQYLQVDGCTIVDSLITFHPLSLALRDSEAATIYAELGVPVFQALTTTQSPAAWRENPAGVTAREVATLSAQPEHDGVLTGGVVAAKDDTIDPATGAVTGRWVPLAAEVTALATLAAGWAKLRHTAANKRKVAIILHQHTPQLDRVGAATGLDAFASVEKLLHRLAAEGYQIGDIPTADDIAKQLTRQLVSGDGWINGDQALERAGATVDSATAAQWHNELPSTLRAQIEDAWGPAPGEVYTHNGITHLAVQEFGHAMVMVQPPRGILETMTATSVHDGRVAPPHVYMTAYRWLQDAFGAHAIIHLGSHGSIEWLPGQALGLAADSATEVALGGIPNIYPYVVNNPGEVTQAKRRSHGVTISHMPPPVRHAGLHGELAAMQRAVQDFTDAAMKSPETQRQVAEALWDAVDDAGIGTDFGMDRTAALADIEHFVEHVHHYLLDLGDNQINDGLHVLGNPPTGDRLAAYVAALLRHGTAETPSLRAELARAKNLDLEELAKDASVIVDGVSAGDLVLGVDDLATTVVREVLEGGEPTQVLASHDVPAEGRLLRAVHRVPNMAELVCAATNELDAIVAALNAEFIAPGPSGVPTRGDLDVFPTGRNMVTLDPRDLPTPAAHAAGIKAADALLKRFSRSGDHADHSSGGSHRGESHSTGVGAAPKRHDDAESVAVVLWGTATMRSRGEDIGQALHLLGVKPTWDDAGHVVGVEPIPLAELGRARVDVTLKISGLFRDAFPQAVELLDEAVRLVATLEEPSDRNFVRAHVAADVAQYTSEGRADQAWELATARIYGPAPGDFGTGVDISTQTGSWKTTDDLADTFVKTTGYAYGGARQGTEYGQQFRHSLSRIQATVHNEATAESDMLASDARFSEHGGLIAAVTQARGAAPQSFVGDTTATGARQTTLAEAVRSTARSRLLNPAWVESMKAAGYSGAAQLSMAVDAMAGWSATADAVDSTMLDRLARNYLDGETKEWLEDVNPHALAHIAGKFLDLAQRDLWDAADDAHKLAVSAYMEAEGAVEEATDDE